MQSMIILYIHLMGTRTVIFSSSHLVIYICDVHGIEDIIFEIVLQYSSEDIKGYVGPVVIEGKICSYKPHMLIDNINCLGNVALQVKLVKKYTD